MRRSPSRSCPPCRFPSRPWPPSGKSRRACPSCRTGGARTLSARRSGPVSPVAGWRTPAPGSARPRVAALWLPDACGWNCRAGPVPLAARRFPGGSRSYSHLARKIWLAFTASLPSFDAPDELGISRVFGIPEAVDQVAGQRLVPVGHARVAAVSRVHPEVEIKPCCDQVLTPGLLGGPGEGVLSGIDEMPLAGRPVYQEREPPGVKVLIHRYGGRLIGRGGVAPRDVIHPARRQPAKQQPRPGVVLVLQQSAQLEMPFHHPPEGVELLVVRRVVFHRLQQPPEHDQLIAHRLR